MTIPKPEPVPKADDHAKPHVEEIINKLMTGLDVQAKDAKRYTASNIKVASKFKNELRSGNYLYNVVHVVPATFKSGVSLFSKLAGKLMTSKRAKDSMHELEKRVNNLTEEELEVLFEEYRGSQLKTDMNVQINPLILPKLKEYGMKKVRDYNVILTNCYSLFPLAVPVLVFCILHGICDAYVGQNEAFQGFVHLLPVVSVLLYIPHDAVLCILKALKAHYAQVVCKQVAGNLYHAVLAFYFDICNYIFHNY